MIKCSLRSGIGSRRVGATWGSRADAGVRPTCVLCLAAFGFVAVAGGANIPAGRADLLERTGVRVKQFWDELSSVACTENLLQERLNAKGKVAFNSRSSYDYLISMRWDQGGMLVDESRLPIGQQQKKAPKSSLLVTQGFAALLMIFHPEFQPDYAFTLEGEQKEGNTLLERVAFIPRKGSPSPAALSLKDHTYPIAWEGEAWIEPERAVIMRIDAHWKDPAEEIGLRSLSSEVLYAPISFRGSSQSMWLPEKERIEVNSAHQEWRNTHSFTNYRQFSVKTEDKIEEVKK